MGILLAIQGAVSQGILWGIMALFAIVAVVLLVFSVEKRPEDPPVGVELVRAAEGS